MTVIMTITIAKKSYVHGALCNRFINKWSLCCTAPCMQQTILVLAKKAAFPRPTQPSTLRGTAK